MMSIETEAEVAPRSHLCLCFPFLTSLRTSENDDEGDVYNRLAYSSNASSGDENDGKQNYSK